jgi:hypothetical protein
VEVSAVARSRLAQEVTAFLGGYHLEVTGAFLGRKHVEPWMWLNAPAHRLLPEIETLAAEPHLDQDSSDFSWSDARAVVCEELLRRCAADPTLMRRIQSDGIVPLELELVGRSGLTPWSLAQLTLAVLSRTSEV